MAYDNKVRQPWTTGAHVKKLVVAACAVSLLATACRDSETPAPTQPTTPQPTVINAASKQAEQRLMREGKFVRTPPFGYAGKVQLDAPNVTVIIPSEAEGITTIFVYVKPTKPGDPDPVRVRCVPKDMVGFLERINLLRRKTEQQLIKQEGCITEDDPPR